MNRRAQMRRAAIAGAFLLASAVLFWIYDAWFSRGPDDPQASIALLVADGVSASDPRLAIWTDAAREEGLRVQVISASDFLRPQLSPWRSEFAGIILPDSIARNAGGPLLQRLTDYVAAGGKLMPVYDAATHTPAGIYYAEKAPLSALVGVEYALYDALKGNVGEAGFVWGRQSDLRAIGIPPGKSMAAPMVLQPAQGEPNQVIVGYQYGPLRYNYYATHGQYDGERLLTSAAGSLVAGYRKHGKGGVLFVNLPLGYLKGRTDGLLLHGFLRYFADTVLALPSLSAVPNGRGGLVFNWHLDSNAAIGPMEELEQLGLLRQGPFSIHLTAGPDARKIGDGLGMDLSRNAAMQRWVRYFKQRGDAIGNHGGWVHDYFGKSVTEDNQKLMERFLEMNSQSVESLIGAPAREYSAPLGNQPLWVTQWLESRGYVAYYFVGNTGMAPTRSYREGALKTKKIWSFPVLTYGKVASFEEADDEEIGAAELASWLKSVSDFAADSGTVRTFYSHPPGFRRYPGVFKEWFNHTGTLLGQHRFAWYTMSQIGDFLNRRERTSWHVMQDRDRCRIEASHPTDLDQLAWRFPKAAFGQPVLEKGSGRVVDEGKYWLVIANTGKILGISTKKLSRGGTH